MNETVLVIEITFQCGDLMETCSGFLIDWVPNANSFRNISSKFRI